MVTVSRPGLGLVAPDTMPPTYAPMVELALEYEPAELEPLRQPFEANVPGMVAWFLSALALAAVINHAFGEGS